MAKPSARLTNDNRGLASPGPEQPPAHPVDATDLAILVHLLRDARVSVRRIAAAVGMSAPAVTERIARLERSAIIRGYRAEVDWAKLGYAVIAYVLVTGVQGWEQTETMEALRSLLEVEDVMVVTGASDLLVRVRVRDQQHLRECLFDRLWKVPGVHRTETVLCLTDPGPRTFDLHLAEAMLAASRGDRASQTVPEPPLRPSKRSK